jgi:nucleotide-binding universal stress UspA family protein
MNKLLNHCEKLGIKAREFLVFEEGREDVEQHLSEDKDDLIIMGTYGDKGFIKQLFGSNTQQVIRNSNVPVLSMKNKIKLKAISSIVFASDFEDESQKAISKVTEFASLAGAIIHLLHVYLPGHADILDDVKMKMEDYAKRNKLNSYSVNVFESRDTEIGILDFSSSIKAGMIAIATHGRKGIRNIYSPSIAEAVVNHAEIPVMSINLKLMEEEE